MESIERVNLGDHSEPAVPHELVIPFNPFEGCSYIRSQDSAIEKFKDFLIKKGFVTTLRITRGDAIDGACGQLVGKLSKSIKGKKLISHKLIS